MWEKVSGAPRSKVPGSQTKNITRHIVADIIQNNRRDTKCWFRKTTIALCVDNARCFKDTSRLCVLTRPIDDTCQCASNYCLCLWTRFPFENNCSCPTYSYHYWMPTCSSRANRVLTTCVLGNLGCLFRTYICVHITFHSRWTHPMSWSSWRPYTMLYVSRKSKVVQSLLDL